MTETRAPGPEIKIHPLMLLRAVDLKLAGAFRLWTIGKALDSQGRGVINRNTLRNYCLSLGVNRKTFYRWQDQALGMHFIIQGKDSDIILPSPARLAFYLGLDRVERRATMDARELLAQGWHAHAYAAFLATTNARPIQRAIIARLTGLSPATQRRLDQAGRIDTRKNFVLIEQSPKKYLASYREFESPKHFKFKAYWTKAHKPVIAKQVSNTYVVPNALARRGRTRKNSKTLRQMNQRVNGILLKTQQDQNTLTPWRKLPKVFVETTAELNDSLHKAKKLPTPDQPQELYRLRYASNRSNFWIVRSLHQAESAV